MPESTTTGRQGTRRTTRTTNLQKSGGGQQGGSGRRMMSSGAESSSSPSQLVEQHTPPTVRRPRRMLPGFEQSLALSRGPVAEEARAPPVLDESANPEDFRWRYDESLGRRVLEAAPPRPPPPRPRPRRRPPPPQNNGGGLISFPLPAEQLEELSSVVEAESQARLTAATRRQARALALAEARAQQEAAREAQREAAVAHFVDAMSEAAPPVRMRRGGGRGRVQDPRTQGVPVNPRQMRRLVENRQREMNRQQQAMQRHAEHEPALPQALERPAVVESDPSAIDPTATDRAIAAALAADVTDEVDHSPSHHIPTPPEPLEFPHVGADEPTRTIRMPAPRGGIDYQFTTASAPSVTPRGVPMGRRQQQERGGWQLQDMSYEALLRLDVNNTRHGLSRLQLDKLRRRSEAGSTNGLECAICLDSVSTHGLLLSCTHGFHDQCISRWFAQNTQCPVCRKDYAKT